MSAIQYCLNTSTIRPASLMEKIRIAGAAGYRGIELWNDDLSAHMQQGGSLAEIRRALDDQGLQVPTAIAAFGWLESTGPAHQRALDEVRRRLEQAALVGARHLIASPAMEACDLSPGGARYRELLELGRQFGVKPAMEYLGFVGSVHTIAQGWKIVQEAEHPDASLIMDPFHILRGGSPLADIALVPGEKVAIWHWNDVPGTKPVSQQSDEDRVLPGDGVGPLKEIERLALQQGYRGFVSLELFNPALWQRDPAEVARLGMEKMKAYFAG
ncbi:MAG: sugar phosphate isomerase/epimerase [Candidatus Latescibacteria bacterium]|nr:sugar phosphate isomerase/epimerase [Candidatus Latescibacterota bacterium]